MARLGNRPAAIWAGVIWIGGLGVLIGSVIFSTFGVASGASSGSPGVTANQGAPGSSPWPVGVSGALPAGSNVIGSVGISGSLPGGSNDIGTVHVADPSLTVGETSCAVDSTSHGRCEVSTGTFNGPQNVFNTLSVFCDVATGHRVEAAYETQGVTFFVPLVLNGTSFASGEDQYEGTLSDLGLPVSGLFEVVQDYETSASLAGATCFFNVAGT
jgi:hypothetical protein